MRRVIALSEGRPAGEELPGVEAVLDRILELAIPLELAGVAPGDETRLRFSLLQSGEVLERLPADQPVSFVVPGVEDESALWSA